MQEVKPANPGVGATQLLWTDSTAIPAGNGVSATTRIYLGFAAESGLTLRAVTVVASSLVPLSTTDFYLFRPFVTTVVDGVSTVRYLSAGRGSGTMNISPDKPFRTHDEETFNLPLIKGQMVGVDVLTTSAAAPGNLPSSVRASFLASLVRRVRQ